MFTFDKKAIEDVFVAAGFDDVMVEEEVVARREVGDPWEVVVDKGGRIKATRVRAVGSPKSNTRTVRGRTARILIESTEQTTLMFQLTEVQELADLLAALDDLDRGGHDDRRGAQTRAHTDAEPKASSTAAAESDASTAEASHGTSNSARKSPKKYTDAEGDIWKEDETF